MAASAVVAASGGFGAASVVEGIEGFVGLAVLGRVAKGTGAVVEIAFVAHFETAD